MLDLHGFLWKPVAEETYGSSESEQDETAWKVQENCPGRYIVSYPIFSTEGILYQLKTGTVDTEQKSSTQPESARR